MVVASVHLLCQRHIEDAAVTSLQAYAYASMYPHIPTIRTGQPLDEQACEGEGDATSCRNIASAAGYCTPNQ